MISVERKPREREIFFRLPVLQTPRLLLRAMTMDDAAAMYAYASNPRVARYTVWDHHRSLNDTLRYLACVCNNYQQGKIENWGIVHKADNTLIGTCGFFAWDTANNRAEIHYALSAAYAGRGLMTEAVTALLAFGFDTMRLHRIEAKCMTANKASAKVMRKCGMRYEGLMRQGLWAKNNYQDLRMFAILRSAWDKRIASRGTALRTVCVFCGSNAGNTGTYAAAARALGTLLARQKLQLVYGGGAAGLMGELADAVIASGGQVTGIIPDALAQRDLAHRTIPALQTVETMHERKALMAQLADGFIALPGGIGTLEEFTEILTWAQLGLHDKPCGLVNSGGYFDGFIGFLDSMVAKGFLSSAVRSLVIIEQSPARLIGRMKRQALRRRTAGLP